jgi:hypothetical protein
MAAGSGGMKPLSGYGYDIAVGGGNIVLPVDITTFGTDIGNLNFDTPKYLVGNGSIGANYYFPFYQNTSSTANGYIADSTSQYNPWGAAQLLINNGDHDWWVIEYENYSGNSTAGTSVRFDLALQMVANANANVQIALFNNFNINPNMPQCDTGFQLSTHRLVENQPIQVSATTYSSPTSLVLGKGVMMKVDGAGVRVDVTGGGFQAYLIR